MKIYTLAACLCLSSVSFGQAGSLNTQFNGGTSAIQIGIGHSVAEDVAVQTDGKIVLAGQTAISNGVIDVANMAILRLNSNGTLDSSFGVNGKLIINFSINGSWLTAVAIQNDGKIVVGGSYATGSQVNFVLMRFLSNGSPDATFGNNGVTTTNVDLYSYVKDLLIQPDGKIVVAGEAADLVSSDVTVARYLPDGTPDVGFSGGAVIFKFNATGDDYVKTISITNAGKLLVGGSSNSQFAIAELTSSGTLDENFGNGGILISVVGPVPGFDTCLDIDVQGDGKIVAVAEGTGTQTSSDIFVLRFTNNGQPDNSFGTNGIYTADVNGSFDQATCVSILNNGKILIAGNTNILGVQKIFVSRLTQAGNLDVNFGTSGLTITAVGTESYVYSMALRGTDIFVAGVEINTPNLMMVSSFTNDAGPLPVRFSSFTAQKLGNQVVLKWQTEYEEQTKSFVTEKSIDGRIFNAFKEVPAVGNTTAITEYRAIDDKPFSDVTYYRVKSVDLDGSIAYTKILSIKNGLKDITIAPNPAGSFTQLQLPAGINDNVTIEMFDMSGRMVRSSKLHLTGSALSFPISFPELKAGSYLVKISGDKVYYSQQLVKE